MNSIPASDSTALGAGRALLRLWTARWRMSDVRALPCSKWCACALVVIVPGSLAIVALLWLVRRLAPLIETGRRWQAARTTPDSHRSAGNARPDTRQACVSEM